MQAMYDEINAVIYKVAPPLNCGKKKKKGFSNATLYLATRTENQLVVTGEELLTLDPRELDHGMYASVVSVRPCVGDEMESGMKRRRLRAKCPSDRKEVEG